MNVFIKKGKLIILEKLEEESFDILNERANFILEYKKKKLKMDQLIKLSILWSNAKFKKCVYNTEIMNLIN
jgi:hypothetical protein